MITNLKQITTTEQTQSGIEELKEDVVQVFEEISLQTGKDYKPSDYLQDNGEIVYFDLPQDSSYDINVILAFENVVLGSIFGNEIIETGETEIKSHKHPFTEEEHNLNASEMAKFYNEVEILEAQKKEVMDEYKARISAANANCQKFARYVSNGYVTVDEECHKIYNYDRLVVMFKSVKTGEIVSERSMTPNEQQYKLAI